MFRGVRAARESLERMTQGVVRCPAISNHYLRSSPRSDARKIVALYKEVYDIDRCLGSLDMTKIHRPACPLKWQDQFEGKEGYPTVGLEAAADYSLWIWHIALAFLDL